jgi:hypothetical protein
VVQAVLCSRGAAFAAKVAVLVPEADKVSQTGANRMTLEFTTKTPFLYVVG